MYHIKGDVETIYRKLDILFIDRMEHTPITL